VWSTVGVRSGGFTETPVPVQIGVSDDRL
jgi:hypothetical protein